MSTITIECKNKTLTIVDSPSIEIGGVNSLQFSFCPLWDGYSKTVHFYKNETDCNPVEIVNNLAEIPSDLISEGASFFFFVDGVSGELKRRSQIFKCKVESSLLVVENPDSDIQLRLIDLIENIDTSFDYSDMTDEDKLKLREGLSAYQKKFTYHLGLSAGISSFTLPDENYREGADIVNIHLNGIYLHEGLDYSLSGRTVTLTNSIVHPSVAEVSIIRAVIINSDDYSLLRGEKGDRGIQGERGLQGEQGIQGEKGDKGDTGAKGDTGVSVVSVVQTTTSTDDDGNNVITVTLSNGQTSTFTIQNGSKGSPGIQGETGSTGNGISSIAVSESTADGGNNVVTINMTNGTFKTFNVKNGSKGADGSGGNVDLSGYLPLSGGTMEGELHFNGGDGVGASKISLGANGQITDASTSTLFGRMSGDSSFLYVGSSGYGLKLRGKLTRPLYNGSDMALKSDIPAIPSSLPASDVYAWAKASSKPSYSASEVGAVPTSRTVNGKALSGNITLSASDVGASKVSYLSNSTTIPAMSVGELKIVGYSSWGSGANFKLPSGGSYYIVGVEEYEDSTIEDWVGMGINGTYSGGNTISTGGYHPWILVYRIS